MNEQLIKKIKDTEEEYLKCYCEQYDENNKVRYVDRKLSDMYDYNCIHIKKTNSQTELFNIIEAEKNYRKDNGYEFCRIFMEDKPQLKYFDESYKNIEIEHNGIYVYKPMENPEWIGLKDCIIKRIMSEAEIKDLISMDIISNSKYCGKDFCVRRSSSHGEIFIDENKPLNCYICYLNNIPVGHCQLMIKNKIAKIEDFEVLESYRKRGIGKTIIKYLIEEALKRNVEIIYLVADEDDTVKDMYMNMGFDKVNDEYGMLIKFNESL